MEKRAIAITVGSIITMLLLAFLIWCTVLFWQNKAKKDTSYQDGYDAGLEDKAKLEIEITELKKDKSNLTVQLADAQNTITANNANIESLNSQKSELQSQVTKLTATNELNAQEITRLSTIKTENENKINELTAQNATQTATINQHIATIATNNATIKNLQSVNEDCETQIASLNLQLTSANTNKNELQQKITGYEATIEQNKLQIASLQATRTELETRINDLNDSSSQQSSTIATQKALISEYMTIIATNDVTIQNLQSENATAEAEISNLNSQLSTANASINELEQQITGYKATVEQNKLQIADLQATKVELQARIDDLTASNTQNSTTITSLQAHINSLNEQITQLTKTNNTNIATISQLNTQISSLTNRINELSALNVEQSQKISDLNSQVVKLTNYIQKYEQFLSGFESDTQAVATFEYDGALYAIQLVTNGGYASVTTPTSTQYVVFSGWTVNNEIVDISTYPITENTKFVASVTYKYDVQFVADDDIVESQIVAKGTKPTAVTAPVKAGYRFLGWSKDGVNIVDPTTVAINGTTTFTALYIQQFSVRFLDDNSTELKTQTLDKSAKATAPTVTSTDHKVFNGWTVSGAIVDVSNYPITQNTDFVANYTYKYDVLFKNGDSTVSTQLITKDNCATVPTTPTKDGYKFLGWSINGTDTVAPATYKITANTTFTALWIQLHTVSFMRGDSVLDTQIIEHGKTATAPTVASTTYEVFNGWTLDGKTVTPNTYTINANAVFVADITYKYDVKFMNGNTAVSTQIVVKGECASAVTNPVKAGYRFLGWSKDGVNIVDPTTVAINGTTTFTALYIQQFSVRFLDDNSTELKTQTLDKSAKATAPTVTSTDHKVFNGWTVSGAIVDVSNYPITQNTDFVANYTYKYDVLFKNGDSTVSTQLITKNNCATAPTTPTKDGYTFLGWSINGTDTVAPATYKITANTTFIALWEEGYTVTFMNDTTQLSQQVLLSNETISAPTAPTVSDKAFAGWSLDKYNVVDLTNYNLQSDVTFYAVYANPFIGHWTGTCVTEGYDRTIELFIYDSGMAKYSIVDNNNSSKSTSAYCCLRLSSTNVYYLEEFMDIYLYLQDDNSLIARRTDAMLDPSLEYNLTKSNERLEQSYIVNFSKEVTTDGSTYSVVFDGYSCTLPIKNISVSSKSFDEYVILGDKIILNDVSGMFSCYYFAYDFELTDTSITVRTNTYIFAQDVDDSTQEKETAGQSSYTK